MSSENSKKILFTLMCLIMLPLAAFSVVPTECQAFEITIDVSPNVLSLDSNGQVVIVHTDIAFEDVAASTVYIDDVAISSWKSDLRGYFVAKFVMNEIKRLISDSHTDGYYTFKLIGDTTDGDTFSGSQKILVVDNQPE
jgi:hypothetical protein